MLFITLGHPVQKIYVDTEMLKWGECLTAVYEGTLGLSYNTSHVSEPDPEFVELHWDFTVSGFGAHYDNPWVFIA